MGLGLVEHDEPAPLGEGLEREVEPGLIGGLLEIEVVAAEPPGEGRLAALTRPDERDGGEFAQPTADERRDAAGDHLLKIRNSFLFFKAAAARRAEGLTSRAPRGRTLPTLVPRHFLTLLDLGREELLATLSRAHELKKTRGRHARPLEGKSVAIVLEKASTRTRVSFEVGVSELGGHPITLLAKDTQIGRGEPIEDTARMLSGYVHAIVHRTFGHDRVESLARCSSVPVVNGLSDRFHPCQLLADLMTVQEELGPELRGVPVAWIGDGNNVAHSWMLGAALVGLDLRIASPEGYEPDRAVLALAEKAAADAKTGASIRVVRDPKEAARGARVVTTDVWASMGQEDEAAARRAAFAGTYLVDEALMALAPGAVFLHCLPAHRGEEVSAGVIDGPASRVWAEAENRLHSQKALLERLVR
jgi:ornithine carbamoyltransferase